VYDDQIAGLVDLCDAFGEEFVGGVVVHPHWVWGRGWDGGVLPEEVVEEGPERCAAALARVARLEEKR
jgi:hypothetical protein